MNETKEQPKKNPKKKADIRLGISPAEWAISITLGAASGLVTAAATIRNKFGEEVKSWPGIEELYNKHTAALEKMNADFRGDPTHWKEHQRAIDALKDEFALTRDTLLKEQYGIITRGKRTLSLETLKGITYGTWQRLGFAGKSTEGKIIFNAIIGMVLGSAMTLSFFNGVASRHKIEKIEDATDDIKATLEDQPVGQTRPSLPETKVTTIQNHQKLADNDPSLAVRA